MKFNPNKKECLPDLNVRPFSNIGELREAVRCNDATHPQSKYPRGGTAELGLLEKKVANIFNFQGSVVVFSYGMSGVVAALESERPTKDTVVMHGANEYSNNKKYIEGTLAERGVKTITAESYSLDYLEKLIKDEHPNIIFLETVANGPEIPVLDVEGFFKLQVLKELNPLIILDNTLAAGIISPQEILKEGFRVIGVESGLKFYTKHRGSFGFIYTNDSDLANRLKEYRKRAGTAPDLYQTLLVNERLIGRWELFQRNRRIFSNAKLQAELCTEAEDPESAFSVSYPNLPNHPNFSLASAKFPDGAAPLFFIKPRKGKNQFDIAEALLENPVVKEECAIIESFGYDFTAIWPNADLNFVRISTGTGDEDETRELGCALRDSLKQLNRGV